MAELSDADVFGSSPPAAATGVPGEMSDADVFGAPQKPSVAESAVAPITDIPSTYSRMVNENVARMGRGVGQIESGGLGNIASGVGNVALGGMGYLTAPINAPLHTIVGNPVHEATGSELAGDLAEAAAGFALPVPKGIPRIGKAAELPAEAEFGITRTGGELANDMGMRQAEANAIRNNDPHALAWDAQRQAQRAAANEGLIRGLDPYGQILADTPQEAGSVLSEGAQPLANPQLPDSGAEPVGGLQRAAAARKAAVTAAYNEAKALPGEIHAGAFEGMPQQIKGDLSLADEPVTIDTGTTPHAAKMLDYLDNQIGNLKIQNKADPFGPPNPQTITGVNLRGIDQWRKNLSTMRSDAFGASPPGKVSGDARAAQAVLNAFDDRIDQAVNGGLFTGDKSAVNAWNNARAANADYQSTFGVRKGDPVSRVVQKIIGDKVNDPMTPGKVTDQIVGSVTNPSTLNIGVANRLKSILGEQSPEWIAAKQGVLRKVIEAGEGEAPLGTGQVAQRLSKFLNSDMASAVYTPAEQATLRAYANLNRQITMPPGKFSPSGPAIQQAMGAIRSRIGGIVGAIIARSVVPMPLIGELAGYTAGAQTEKALERLHSGVSKQLPIVADQMAKWSRAQSAAMAQPTNPLLRQGAIGATVNLQKALTPLGIDMKQLSGVPPGPGPGNAQPNQQNVPGPVQAQKTGGRIEQQRATGGKVGGDSRHKGPLNRGIGVKARRAKDGRLYIPDAHRPGKFLMVVPRS